MPRSLFPPDGGTSEDWPPDYMQPRPTRMPKKRCESRNTWNAECKAEARFIVSRGRKHDAELCCGRHLASTVTALTEGQTAGVTVTPVHAHALEVPCD